MISRELRIACVSDIHLGHTKNLTANILKNLDREINNRDFLSSIDILFIAGDFFDHLLSFASQEALQISQFISRLLRRASRYQVTVRVLEGTPSHDRKQSVHFVENDEKHQKAGLMAAKLKYIDSVSIEHIEEFGINVLYVPDEAGPTTQGTLARVKELMAQEGLEQVDLAIMHGFFPHQMGNIPYQDHVVHDPQEYLSLVSGLIFIGHVHTFSQFERIIAQGSFDRLAHNEEEAKGFVKAILYPNGNYEAKFIENKGAARFITLVCQEDTIVDNLLWLDKSIEKLPSGAHVRIQAPPGHPILTNEKVLQERWPQFNWAVQAKDQDRKKDQILLDIKKSYSPVIINQKTILPVVKERLIQRQYSNDQVERCDALLKEIYRA